MKGGELAWRLSLIREPNAAGLDSNSENVIKSLAFYKEARRRGVQEDLESVLRQSELARLGAADWKVKRPG